MHLFSLWSPDTFYIHQWEASPNPPALWNDSSNTPSNYLAHLRNNTTGTLHIKTQHTASWKTLTLHLAILAPKKHISLMGHDVFAWCAEWESPGEQQAEMPCSAVRLFALHCFTHAWGRSLCTAMNSNLLQNPKRLKSRMVINLSFVSCSNRFTSKK